MGGAVAVQSTAEAVGDPRFFSKANAKPLGFAAIAVLGAVLYGEYKGLTRELS